MPVRKAFRCEGNGAAVIRVFIGRMQYSASYTHASCNRESRTDTIASLFTILRFLRHLW